MRRDRTCLKQAPAKQAARRLDRTANLDRPAQDGASKPECRRLAAKIIVEQTECDLDIDIEFRCQRQKQKLELDLLKRETIEQAGKR